MKPEELTPFAGRDVVIEFTDGEVIEARVLSVDSHDSDAPLFIEVLAISNPGPRATKVGELLGCGVADLQAVSILR